MYLQRSMASSPGVPDVDAGRLPRLLTVDEAARELRIGRSLAYELAREYLASGGTAGLPVIRLGSCLRVPCWALLELSATGRVVRLCDAKPLSAGVAGGR